MKAYCKVSLCSGEELHPPSQSVASSNENEFITELGILRTHVSLLNKFYLYSYCFSFLELLGTSIQLCLPAKEIKLHLVLLSELLQ